MIARTVMRGLAVVLDSGPRGPEVLFPEEAAAAGHFASGRLADYCAGRFCAHAATRLAGAQPGAILNAMDGSPGWPAGYAGSISHCPGMAAACVARADTACATGIDVEQVGRIDRDLWPAVFGPGECDFLASLAPCLVPAYSTALFCLKECFLKLVVADEATVDDLKQLRVYVRAPEWHLAAAAGSLSRFFPRCGRPELRAYVEFLGRHVIAVLSLRDGAAPMHRTT